MIAKDRLGHEGEARASHAPPSRSFGEFTLSAANVVRMTRGVPQRVPLHVHPYPRCAESARQTHPASNATPPSGVMAPSQRAPLSARA